MVYQDPLLLPGYLKKVVQNLPGKVKVSQFIIINPNGF